jgi:hypothetical protein
MSEKTQAEIRLRKFPLEQYRDTFNTPGHYSNCKCMLKKLNTHFKLEQGIVHASYYNEHYKECIELIIDEYTLRNHKTLLSRVGMIKALMARGGWKTTEFHKREDQIREIPLEIMPKVATEHDWEETLKLIDTAILQCPSASGRAFLVCYKHGYCLRARDIFETSTHKSTNFNYLDLQNKHWYILAHRTKQNASRDFPVSQEFVDEITPYINPKFGFLCCKNNGCPYREQGRNLNIIKITGVPSITTMRNAYEKWNWYDSDRTEEQRKHWSENVLGHTVRTAMTHYTPNPLLNDVE